MSFLFLLFLFSLVLLFFEHVLTVWKVKIEELKEFNSVFVTNLCSTTVFDSNKAAEFILSHKKISKWKATKEKNLFVSEKEMKFALNMTERIKSTVLQMLFPYKTKQSFPGILFKLSVKNFGTTGFFEEGSLEFFYAPAHWIFPAVSEAFFATFHQICCFFKNCFGGNLSGGWKVTQSFNFYDVIINSQWFFPINFNLKTKKIEWFLLYRIE